MQGKDDDEDAGLELDFLISVRMEDGTVETRKIQFIFRYKMARLSQ